MQYIDNVEDKLNEFGQISEANSINPQTISDLLTTLLEEVDHRFALIYANAGTVKVTSRTLNTLRQHLNTLYDKAFLFESFFENLRQSGILSEQVTVQVSLASGVYDADAKDIHWYAANGKIVLRQWKANSTTNVSADYVAAPRLYKEHILHFQAMKGYSLVGVVIKYSGQYKGNSITTGTELDETGSNVIDDEVAIARQWGTINDGEHHLFAADENGLSDIYLQNVASSVVQLRITSISVTYKNHVKYEKENS